MLLALDHDKAMTRLQELPGVGPFSAELVLIRGCGDPVVFPRAEGHLHRAMTEAYSLGEHPDLDALEAVAARWRPYRSWVGLMARDASVSAARRSPSRSRLRTMDQPRYQTRG